MIKVIYKLNDGRFVSNHDMFDAYEIVFGEAASLDSANYLNWLFKRLHFSVKEVWGVNDAPLVEVAKSSTVLAALIYRERTDCTVREARDYIHGLLEGSTKDEP